MLYFAAVFVNCLLFAPVVKATTRESLFSDTGLDNVVFTSSVLFETESRSLLNCALQCIHHEQCVTFTHITGSSSGSCRGHNAILNSHSDHDASVTGAKTVTKSGKYLWSVLHINISRCKHILCVSLGFFQALEYISFFSFSPFNCSLIKGITPEILMLCFGLTNSVILNFLCVWILF